MTEPERIYQENWLNSEFWKEEIRCGYKVTSNMKRVWAVEMDLYREFARVCEENGLSYFTDGGTTLGAVRHKGFIPWDGDMDVCMPRQAYEKLKELAQEFKSPYFLQNVYTDSDYGYSFMKLRNENTAAIAKSFSCCMFNQGIFIDIFPLDKVTVEDYLPRRQRMHELIMKNSAYMRYRLPDKSDGDRFIVEKYYDSSLSTLEIFEQIEKLATQDEALETEYVSLLVSTKYDASKKIWPRRVFDGYIEEKFEDIKVRIPSGYDEQLKIYFGNYMEYPPVDQRIPEDGIRFYPDISYRKVSI